MRFSRVAFIRYMCERCAVAELDICCSGVASINPEDFDLRMEDVVLDPAKTKGLPTMPEIIAAHYGVTPDMVFPTAGSTFGAFMTMAMIFNDQPGAAMIEKPTYTPLQDAVGVFSHDVRSTPRWFEDDWALDIEELERNWDPSVRLIILCNLNNPTGRRTPDDVLRAVAEIAGRSGGYVLVDEVFRNFDYDTKPGCAASVAPNVITVSSFTKAFGFGALRYGWFIGPPELRDKLAKLNEYFAISDHYPASSILRRAFENYDMLVARTRKIIDTGRQLFEEWIATRDDLEYRMPDAGPIVFPRLKDGGDTTELVDKLHSEEKIQVAAGRYFGDPSGFRLSFGIPPESIERGYAALGRILDERRESG